MNTPTPFTYPALEAARFGDDDVIDVAGADLRVYRGAPIGRRHVRVPAARKDPQARDRPPPYQVLRDLA